MNHDACPYCRGFGWRPVGADGAPRAWDGRDLEPVLDPTRAWERCPCRAGEAGLERLQSSMAEWLLARLDQEGGPWTGVGPWRHGALADGTDSWRWEGLACLADGRSVGSWILVSEMGVMVGLDDAELGLHLARAGAPKFPPLSGA